MNERCRLLQTCRRGPRRLYRGGASLIVVDVVVSASLTRRRAPERLILLPITHRQKINVFDENLYWSMDARGSRTCGWRCWVVPACKGTRPRCRCFAEKPSATTNGPR